MTYIVIELQTMETGQVANIATAYDSLAAAQSKFHTILAAAALSGLPAHAALILDEEGVVQDHGCFRHEEQADE